MQQYTLHQQSYGFTVSFTTGIDMTNTTRIRLLVSKQDDPAHNIDRDLDLSAISSRPKGIVGWPVQDGDLDALGLYEVQLVEYSPGRRLVTDVGSLWIESNVEAIS